MARGAEVGLKLCGMHALDSCRIEKAFRHFGHDITDEDHVLEAGLGFAVKLRQGPGAASAISSAATPCCGREQAGLSRRLVQFLLSDPGRCSTATRRSCATAASRAI